MRRALVDAVRGAHGNRQAIHTGALDELRGLLGMCKARVARSLVLDALAHMAQLRLNGDAHGMGDAHHVGNLRHVVLERKRRAIDHHRAVARADSQDDMFERATVIEVECPRDTRMLGAVVFGDLAGLLDTHGIAHIENHRGIQLLGSVERGLDALLVKHVGRGHSVTAALCLNQQVLHGLKHSDQSPSSRLGRPHPLSQCDRASISLLAFNYRNL